MWHFVSVDNNQSNLFSNWYLELSKEYIKFVWCILALVKSIISYNAINLTGIMSDLSYHGAWKSKIEN